MPKGEESTALVVDDSKEFRELLEIYCKKEGIAVEHCKSGTQLLKKLDNLEQYSLLFLDIVMPGVDGFEALAKVREVAPTIPVIMTTVREDSNSIVRCLRLGATDYITKPLDPTRLRAALANALRTHTLSSQVERLSSALATLPGVSDLIAESAAMKKTLELVDRVADSETTALLLGESGVGKEVIARALHFRSKRRGDPFIAVNCAAVPETLLDSELFGYEPGAFTGAERRRHGKFEAAANGTLFLDEVAEMSRESQVKLLRVLQERRIVRIGANEEIPVGCRVVCATNADLRRAVDEGTFREDLFYRISAFPIEVAPLRDRPEDLDALCIHFMKRFRSAARKRIKGFHPDAIDAIHAYHWPGNVRELENAIDRAVLLADKQLINASDLPEEVNSAVVEDELLEEELSAHEDLPADELKATMALPDANKRRHSSGPHGMSNDRRSVTSRIKFRDKESVVPLANIERAAILAALQICEGDIQEAARRLEISRATIYRRLRLYGINSNDTPLI